MFRNNSGGFVFVEFAIALPLLILLMYGLATVSTQIFYLGKIQLADYVLEEEVHEVLSRIIYDARAAKNVIAIKGSPTLTFTYRMVNESNLSDGVIAVNSDDRVYLWQNSKLYYKRQTYNPTTPITGDDYFGETQVTQFNSEFDKGKKILHVTLEMKSEISLHKIKISTAVYVPGYDN